MLRGRGRVWTRKSFRFLVLLNENSGFSKLSSPELRIDQRLLVVFFSWLDTGLKVVMQVSLDSGCLGMVSRKASLLALSA